MRLAVFGGSGRTGSALLDLASARGWRVQALVRPDSVCPSRPGLEIVRGSLEASVDVEATLRGADAVLCVVGPRSTRSAPFLAAATTRILAALRSAGPRRLVCLTGAMVGELPDNVGPVLRAMARLHRRLCPALAEDAAGQERAVMASGMDWTLVKPPRLTDGSAVEPVRGDRALRVGILSRATRRGLAVFMLDEAVAGRHVRERVYVAD